MQSFGFLLIKIMNYLQWLIIARSFASFLIQDPSNPFYRLLVSVTEPILAPIRNLLPRGTMGIDFSPLVAIIFLSILSNLIR